MDTHLSLIEMGGEDNSLLHQILKDDHDDDDDGDGGNHPAVDPGIGLVDFCCSPLLALSSKRSADPPRFPPSEVSEVNGDGEKPCRSPLGDIDNKRNLNEVNLDVRRTSFKEEPQQMKRRKRGGEYNLRKSLAWNRAFFTEEGVLDPVELSILSGSSVKSSSKFLFSVHEEGPMPLSECSDLSSGGSDMQSEENLSKNSAARSKASRKIQVAKGTNRSVFQEVFSRPLGSSSQKRLSDRNTTNGTTKDSRPPKFPASKPVSSSSFPTTSKTVILANRRPKSNQNVAQVNVERNAGSKGSSNSTKNAPSCTSSSTKSSLHSSQRILAKSSLRTHLSEIPQLPEARKGTYIGLKVTQDLAPPAADLQAPIGHAGSRKVVVPLSQGSNHIGGNNQYAYSQLAKPSGLRMPSPSLQYFDQPNLRKLGNLDHIGEVKLLHAPWRQPKVAADVVTTTTMGAVSSTSGCSIPSVTSASHPTPNSNLELNNVQLVDVENASHPKSSYNVINSQQRQSHSVLDDIDEQSGKQADFIRPYFDEVEHSPCKYNQRLHMSPIQSGLSEQTWIVNDLENATDVCKKISHFSSTALESSHAVSQPRSAMVVKEGVAGTDDMMKHPSLEDTWLESKNRNPLIENHDIISDTQFRDAINNSSPSTLMVHSDYLLVGHDFAGKPGEQAELRKTGPDEVNQIFYKDNWRLQMDDGLLEQRKSSKEFETENDFRHVSKVDSDTRDSGGSQLESLDVLSQLSSAMLVEVIGIGVDEMIKNLHVEGGQLKPSNSNSSVENYDVICDLQLSSGTDTHSLDNSMVHGNHLRVGENVDEQSRELPELRNHCPDEVEHILNKHNITLQRNDKALLEEKRSSEESQLDNDLENAINVTTEGRDSRTSDSESSHVLSQLIPVKQIKEGSSGIDKMTEHSHLEDTSLRSLSIDLSANSNVLAEDTETDLPHDTEVPDDELCCEIENCELPSEVKGARILDKKKPVNDSKADPLSKNHLNAAPFSDEWLAALEAAGEEILTRKTGAVQNSPPDKSLPEPSPWSPVRWKNNQEIGPFDCTKYTNLPSNPH